MAQISIEVINVSAPVFTKTARGGYNFIEVAYKKDGKVEGKKIMDFVSKDVFNALRDSVKPGDVLTVSMEKDAKDYWQWTGISASGAASSGVVEGANATAPASGSTRSGTGRVTGSNYETPEERARRQVLIVRQSSLTAALHLEMHNQVKAQVDPEVVLDLAEAFTKWVFKTDPMQAVAAMKDDPV